MTRVRRPLEPLTHGPEVNLGAICIWVIINP